MGIRTREFGKTPAGESVTMYTISNAGGMSAEIIDFGAVLVGLKVPDAQGRIEDVVLGYHTLDGYLDNPAYFGTTVGPQCQPNWRGGL